MTWLSGSPRLAGLVCVATLTLTSGIALAETTGETDGGSDTDGPEIPPEVTLEVESGQPVADQAFLATVEALPFSATIATIELIVDDVALETSCTDGAQVCEFELTLDAGSHTLVGNATDMAGLFGASEPLTIEVEEAGGTGPGSTGSPDEGTDSNGSSGTPDGGSGGQGETGPEQSEDSGGGCSVSGRVAPVAPLAAMFLLGLVARRRR